MSAASLLAGKTVEQIRHELKGFPPEAVSAVLDLREGATAENLDAAIRHIVAFYLPKGRKGSLLGLPPGTRLREDLGVDSLTMAEAAFKLDDLLGVALDNRETEGVRTLGDLHTLLAHKLGL
jgi:acyl carrier protein